MALPFYKTQTKKRSNLDDDLSYTEYLVVQKKLVEYCEQQNWFDKQFSCCNNLGMAILDANSGYFTGSRAFSAIMLPDMENSDIIIYDSTAWRFELTPEIRKKLKLVKRIEYKNHWGEIYLKIGNDTIQ